MVLCDFVPCDFVPCNGLLYGNPRGDDHGELRAAQSTTMLTRKSKVISSLLKKNRPEGRFFCFLFPKG